jgi:TolB-like protein
MAIWSAEIKELESLYTSIKGRFPELEKELEQLIETKDANVILIYSRRCLEVIITDLCEEELKRPRKTEPLKGIIDKLSHEEKVPSHIIASMQYLNSISTFGAHPKDFDTEQVKPVLSNLAIIIKWYVKYKDTQVISEAKPKETKYESKEPVETKEGTKKSKKRLIFLLSGTLLVVAIVIAVLFVFNIIGGGKQSRELEKSIAILPFQNDSPDEGNTYFINGTMEAILDNLCKIQDLIVIARTSVEQYRNAPKDVTEIAKELNVNYILEGSGQKYEDKIRLTVQLINGKNGNHIWSNQYNRDLKDIFSVQSEIAQLIADELKAIITPEEKLLIEKTPTTSLTAYDFFQKGREEYWKYWVKGDREALEKVEDLYYKALEYDSTFAQAYSGLAMVYWNKHYWSEFFSESFLDSVMILCDVALSYDDQLSEAYTFRGEYYNAIGKPEQAIKEYDNAVKFNPNDWMAYWQRGYSYSNYDLIKTIDNHQKAATLNRGEQLPIILRSLGGAYLLVGFIEKAKYYFEEAFALDGDSVNYLIRLANSELNIGNIENGMLIYDKLNKMDSTIFPPLEWLSITEQHQKAYKFAKKFVDYYKKSGTMNLGQQHRIGYAYYQVGKTQEAEYYFEQQIKYCNESIKLGREYAQNKWAQYDLAGVYAFLGDKEKAYQYLDEFSKLNFYPFWWIGLAKHDPLFTGIRNEERFQKILQNMEAKYQTEHERVRKWLEEQGEI